MMQLYTGVPGSGKSYRLVYDVDKLLDSEPEITIISNIKGLKLPHIDFDELLEECIPHAIDLSDRLEKFFEYEYQAGMNEKFGGPVMYVLDECQTYFPRRKSLPNTELYFQKHRHLGHHILMATQASKLLNQNLVALMELEYQAVRRSASLFGELRYRTKSPQSNEAINTVTLRPKKRIFELYRSFENDELKRPRKEVLRKLWPVLFLPLAAYLFWLGLPKAPEPEKPKLSSRSSRPASPMDIEDRRFMENRVSSQQIETLEREITDLKKKLNDQERVFLTVVEVGDKRLTVDPDTQAVIDIRFLKHKTSCLNNGLTCYFDRPVNSGIKVADNSGRGGSSFGPGPWADSMPSGVGLANSALMSVSPGGIFPESLPVRESPGAFVESDLVPPPDHVRLKVYNGLEN